MKTLFLALLALALLLPPAHGAGFFMYGQTLASMLAGTDTAKLQALAFVVAVHDATSEKHCTPDDQAVGQLLDTVQSELGKLGPNVLGLPAAKLVESILVEAYPCKPTAPQSAPAPVNPRSGSAV